MDVLNPGEILKTFKEHKQLGADKEKSIDNSPLTSNDDLISCDSFFDHADRMSLSPPPLDSERAFSSLPYTLQIHGIPVSGASSRIETQVKLVLRIIPQGNAVPIKWLRLPKHQHASVSSTQKIEEYNIDEDFESNQLQVRASILRSNSMEKLHSCYSCLLRERKRSCRKRAKTENYIDNSHLPEESSTIQDQERIIIFASQSEYVKILRGDAMLPLRITCYCRHHDESVGFRVKLDLFRSSDQKKAVVGSVISPPILITDDHKKKQSKQSMTKAQALTRNMFIKPLIMKCIPNEGPMYGGIEITLFGHHFTPETQIVFGSLPATTVNFINSTVIIVNLPPSLTPGLVNVCIGSGGGQISSNSSPSHEKVVLFNYKNDIDKEMMELALQLIGMKMTGTVDDAKDVALRIINQFSPSSPTNPGVSEHGANNYTPQSFSNIPGMENLETVLITCLAAAEYAGGIKFSIEDISKARTCGGQNLLHLAAFSSRNNLFEYLTALDHGRLLGFADYNGFTPADFIHLLGKQNILAFLGLDDSDCEDDYSDISDIVTRHKFITMRAIQRQNQIPPTTWARITDHFKRFSKHPDRLQINLNRLRNIAWRNYTSDAKIHAYYLKSFGATKGLNEKYQKYTPFNKITRISWIFLFWIPILLGACLIWIFNVGNGFDAKSPIPDSINLDDVFNSETNAKIPIS